MKEARVSRDFSKSYATEKLSVRCLEGFSTPEPEGLPGEAGKVEALPFSRVELPGARSDGGGWRPVLAHP
jgi:hypothetical protein